MKEKDRELLRMVSVLSTVGLTLVFATIIGLYVGLKLDAWLGTSPWLTVLFLIFGLIAGFKNLLVQIKHSQKTLDDQSKDKKND